MKTRHINQSVAHIISIMLLAIATAPVAGVEDKISYPDFAQLVEQGKIRSAEVIRDASASGTTCLRATIAQTDGAEQQTVKVDVLPTEQLLTMLREKGVQVASKKQHSPRFGALASPVPLLIGFAIWVTVIIIFLSLALRLVRAVERIAENTRK